LVSALREEQRLRVFENRVLRKIFGPKKEEVAGGWGSRIMRSFVTCTFHEMLLRLSHQGGLDGLSM
jgi:hypothetical protein